MADAAAKDRAVAALNRLLAAEYVNLLPRIAESDPFVSWAAADEDLAIHDMGRTECDHIPLLTETILDLGGSPVPPHVNQQLAAVHFQDVHALLPEILENKRRTIAQYEQASANLSVAPAAAAAAGRCVDQHRTHLAALEAMAAPPPAQDTAVPAES